ncbi:hypothetical protein GQ55_5G221700 [Panicum hallii var. hallii]|uniref:Uncharacterized protein n=1 Tax=Panicum hallii var. hallii TaxID=1504633 RepID=A0A2T7DIZ8_9POAL|nr:hypothetical protein GQ55_5G221700 [Panicum hallii var. hallii]
MLDALLGRDKLTGKKAAQASRRLVPPAPAAAARPRRLHPRLACPHRSPVALAAARRLRHLRARSNYRSLAGRAVSYRARALRRP